MTYDINIDFNLKKGKIKPIHAVNNQPVQGMMGTWDISNYYRQMAIPYSRLHETDGPYGCDQLVDIHCVFPNFDADENLPESYNFWSTDICLKGIIEAGGKPFYRLGESIDHTPNPLYIHPPKDAGKWARICEHIIRHYNEGWANGFYYGIEYWEIWNEPEGKNHNMWTGTWEQYFELYSVTANHLKKCFGDTIKVGGFAATNTNYLFVEELTERHKYCRDFTYAFFKYITDEKTKAPLDFFSYHRYLNDPRDLYEYNNGTRAWLDSMGFKEAEIILDEWHNGYFKGHYERHSLQVSAETGIALIAGQKSLVDMMMYYDLRRTTLFNCLVSMEKAPLADFFPFEMFGKLYKLGTEVESGAFDEKSPVAVCAATNGKKAGVMICNMEKEHINTEITINFKGVEKFDSMKFYKMHSDTSPCFPTLFADKTPEKEFKVNLGPCQSIAFIEFE